MQPPIEPVDNFLIALGCDEDKMWQEFIKLVASFGDQSKAAQALLTIRESGLSEMERLALTFLLGRFSGTFYAVDDIRGAVHFLEDNALEVAEYLERGSK